MEDNLSKKEARARELFANNYNCAQSVFGVFCEDEGLDLKTALKLANGFGGGFRCGEACGAVSGAIMAIGLKCGFYIEKDIAQKNFCNSKTYEFIEKFTAEHSTILCRELLDADIRRPEDHNPPDVREKHRTICPGVVAAAVRVLEGMDFTNR